MNYKMIRIILGSLLLFEAGFMLMPHITVLFFAVAEGWLPIFEGFRP